MNKTILNEVSFTCQRPIDSDEKSFEERSRSIMSSVSVFLDNKIRTEGFWKISINVNSENKLQHNRVIGGVLRHNIEFSISDFLNLEIGAQKNQMLDLIERTLNEVFSSFNLDVRQLNGIKEFIRARGFKSVFSGPSSRFKETEAYVLCEQKFTKAEIFIVLKKENQEIRRILLLTTSPEEFIFNVYLNEPEWLSENEIRLKASNGEIYSINL